MKYIFLVISFALVPLSSFAYNYRKKEEPHVCPFCPDNVPFSRSNNLTQHLISKHSRGSRIKLDRTLPRDADPLLGIEEGIMLALVAHGTYDEGQSQLARLQAERDSVLAYQATSTTSATSQTHHPAPQAKNPGQRAAGRGIPAMPPQQPSYQAPSHAFSAPGSGHVAAAPRSQPTRTMAPQDREAIEREYLRQQEFLRQQRAVHNRRVQEQKQQQQYLRAQAATAAAPSRIPGQGQPYGQVFENAEPQPTRACDFPPTPQPKPKPKTRQQFEQTGPAHRESDVCPTRASTVYYGADTEMKGVRATQQACAQDREEEEDDEETDISDEDDDEETDISDEDDDKAKG